MSCLAIDLGQHRFDPLDWEDQGLPRADARLEALAARKAFTRACHEQGLRTKCWVLPDQLRQYKSFGVPDGRVRNVFYVTVRSAD